MNKSEIGVMFYAVYKDGNILWQAKGIAKGSPVEEKSSSPVQRVIREVTDFLVDRPGGKSLYLARVPNGSEYLMDKLLSQIVNKFISTEVKVKSE